MGEGGRVRKVGRDITNYVVKIQLTRATIPSRYSHQGGLAPCVVSLGRTCFVIYLNNRTEQLTLDYHRLPF